MAYLIRVRSKVLLHTFFQIRNLSSCATMKKGLVLGIYDTDDSGSINLTPAAQKYNDLVNGKLIQCIQKAGPKLKKAETRLFWNLDDSEYTGVAVVGLGKKDAGFNELEEVHEGKENVREAAAAGCRILNANDIKNIVIENFGESEATAEGVGLSTWLFQEFKSTEKRKEMPKVTPLGESTENKWRIGEIKANAQNWARKLGDTPANRMTPTIFAEEVYNVLTPLGIDVQIHDRQWAEKKKMGSFLSVSNGSAEPPKFLEISYKGAGNDDQPIVFVGKGVTFDSGGISLKSAAQMDMMRSDMGGAACVVSAIKAAAELKLKINIIGLTPLTENLPSGTATKPGDIAYAMNGKSIIIDNTDAEGRLILADALCYSQEFNPRLVLNIATLTGTIFLSLGSAATGVFTNNKELFQVLQKAGSLTGDRMWRMPLWKFFTDKIKKPCRYADLNNIGRKGGGACIAAAFLNEFVDAKTPWLHLDIAGVFGILAESDEGRYMSPGITGSPTRTLIQFLQELS